MAKAFEDYFSELQADMVDICLEYAEDRAEKVYIYCSCEHNWLSSSYFYYIDGGFKGREELNEGSTFVYDTSPLRQRATLGIILENMKKTIDLCKKFEREMPTEIKITYDVKKNSLKAEYQYDLVYYNIPDKSSDDIADEWFEEIKNQL